MEGLNSRQSENKIKSIDIYLGIYWPALQMLTWVGENNEILELNLARLERQNKIN